MKLEKVISPIKNEMLSFRKLLKKSISSNNILIDEVINYILKRKGKQIRPVIVFLSSGICGKINDSTLRAAVLIEILHTATLIHDDVVDESNYRRGYFSINAIWKNKYSVLIGDYLLSSGLTFSLENDDFKFLKVLSNSVKEMSEGEIIQMKKSKSLDLDEELYFKIIEKKTASLFVACCEMGAISSSKNIKKISKLKELGLNLGLAFQIKDDLFPYIDSDSGKPISNDIVQKKLTLPIIYSINKSSYSEKKRVLNAIKEKRDVEYILNFVKKMGGVDYSIKKINFYIQNSIKIIDNFKSSKYKSAFYILLDFLSNRKK
tara:strand:+ start:1021 stop:1977 length:957 start_codon:yes stop_codon:yes gene_type:complete